MNPTQLTACSFPNQTAIITGGADGLGLALARRLISLGARVQLLDRDADKLRLAAENLGPNCRTAAVDVTDDVGVAEVIAESHAAFGQIDILVNSAGITGKTNLKSHEVEIEDFERVFRVNVLGCLTTFRHTIPHMLKAGYGRVLHIASIAGKEGNAGMLAYSSSKAAVIGMTKVQGKEYAQSGITVNALAPAVIQTEMVEKLPEEQVRYMTEKIPVGRCGSLEEFAATSAFIVSKENSFTTGFCFDLSGGRATY